MIKQITFRSRKNKKSRFETTFILTKYGLELSKLAGNNIEGAVQLINDISSVIPNKKNVEAEISLNLEDTYSAKKQNDSPNQIGAASQRAIFDMQQKFETLTPREKETLKHILRYKKQHEVCQAMNIKLNTEKTYRKKLHLKLEVKNFSMLSETERDLLLTLTH